MNIIANSVKINNNPLKLENYQSINIPYYQDVYPENGQWIKVQDIYCRYMPVNGIDSLIITSLNGFRAKYIFVPSIGNEGDTYDIIEENFINPNTSQKINVPLSANFIVFTEQNYESSSYIVVKLPRVEICINDDITDSVSGLYNMPFERSTYPDNGRWILYSTVFCKFIEVNDNDILYVKTKTHNVKYAFTDSLGENGESVNYIGGQTNEIELQLSDSLYIIYVPTGAKYFIANDSTSLTSTPENTRVEPPYVYINSKPNYIDSFVHPSFNPLNSLSTLREQLILKIPYQGNKFVDNVICLMNQSHSDYAYGNAAITFMDSAYGERGAIGYSRNKTLQPTGYHANTLYIEIGNIVDNNPECDTDFRVICTLRREGEYIPLEILCSGQINMKLKTGKTLDVSGGPIQANNGLILKSPDGSRYMLNVDNNGVLSTTKL